MTVSLQSILCTIERKGQKRKLIEGPLPQRDKNSLSSSESVNRNILGGSQKNSPPRLLILDVTATSRLVSWALTPYLPLRAPAKIIQPRPGLFYLCHFSAQTHK